MINWKVRIKNKTFWIAIIPTILLLVSQVLAVFNVHIEVDILSKELIDIVGTIFTILAILGVVVDPTTEGIEDSERAKTYNSPYVKNKGGKR